MLSDKLISLLQSLSKVELNRLRKFVCSPYFNEDPKLMALFDLCNQALRKQPDEIVQLSKLQVWKKIWPGKPFNDLILRRTASELTQLIVRFKAQELWEKDPFNLALSAQKSLETPGLDKHLSGVEREWQRHIETTEQRDALFYLHSSQFHLHQFYRSYRVVAAADYMGKLIPADLALDSYYMIQKLKIYVAFLSYRQYRSTDRTIELPPGFWEWAMQERFSNIPVLRIYRNVLQMMTNPAEEALFFQLLSDLGEWGEQLTPDDLRECCYIAQNYCALKINAGESVYYGRAFEIFKLMADRAVLLESGQLAEGVFKNIITSGLRAGEYAWVEQFIETYSNHLPERIRNNARAYNLANLYSHLKKYDRALEVLRDVEYGNLTYALGAKTILLRIYYEQNEYLALDSLIDSFRIYLRRNKEISKQLQREYNNFLNLVKKLTTLRLSDRKTIAEFRQKVEETSYNTPKKWLLDKIDELR
jgi:hypothetical protein